MLCAFKNEPFIFGIRQRNIEFDLGDIDQGVERLNAVTERINRHDRASIAILEAIENQKLRIAHVINYAPYFLSGAGKNVGCAAVAQTGMAGDAELIIRQPRDADEL